MTKLFGAEYLPETDLIEIQTTPSISMLEHLVQLPAGSNIGLDALSPDDSEKLTDFKKKVAQEIDLSFELMETPYITIIEDICKNAGYNVIYLDDYDLREHEANVVFQIIELEHNSSLFLDKKIDLISFLNSIENSIQIAALDIEVDYTQMNKRIDKLKQKLSLSCPEAAILHLSNAHVIKPEMDSFFSSYFTDEIIDFQIEFNATPRIDNSRTTQLKVNDKYVHLLEHGTFTDKDPDWVGVQKFSDPLKSYFEIFITNQYGTCIDGIFEDANGTGEVHGNFGNYLEFNRHYSPTCQIDQMDPKKFVAELKDGVYVQYEPRKVSFYMEPYQSSTILNMAEKWFDLVDG